MDINFTDRTNYLKYRYLYDCTLGEKFAQVMLQYVGSHLFATVLLSDLHLCWNDNDKKLLAKALKEKFLMNSDKEDIVIAFMKDDDGYTLWQDGDDIHVEKKPFDRFQNLLTEN